MNINALYSVAIVLLMILALIKEVMRPGLILLSALSLFFFTGLISPQEMLAGFSNKGMITVALLFLISEGIRQTGGLDLLTHYLLPVKKYNTTLMLGRIMLPASLLSAFVNNTPVVVILAPAIKNWARRLKINPSYFLIPLSYATIFGGMCTLIGTSTNLLVHGLMIQNGLKGLEMFELVKIGLPIAIIGSLYTSIFGYRLLKERKSVEEEIGERPKEYLIEMQLDPGSPLCHKSISNAGLWGLDGVYILAIERENESLESLNEYEILYPKDRLVFSGNIQSLEDLKGFPGLYFVEEQEFYKDFQHISKHLVEVVVSPRFPGLRKTIEEFDFQQTYGAVVLAVHRNGERINGKIGAIRLRPGDNLILLATNKFTTRWKNSQDFYLVSSESEINEVKPVRAIFSVILLIGMVLGATLGSHWSLGSFQFDMFFFALLVTLLMVWTKCFESRNYTRYISWDVLITIACAFGISSGLTNSGAANLIARELISTLMNFGPVGILAGIYFLTLIFTEVITNNAAAALMFPIALQTAQNMDVSPRPFIIAIAIAASASFSTPIGYQTNLIVQGIGNYKFRDFLKIGIPLSIITMVLAVSLIPRFWSF